MPNFEMTEQLSVLPEFVLDFTYVALFLKRANQRGLW